MRIFKRLFNKTKDIFSYYYYGLKKADIIIYDNVYPHPVSGFRFEEITTLIKVFKNVKLILEPKSYPALKTKIGLHTDHVNQLLQNYSFIKRGQLILNSWLVNINTKLFYCIFLNNIFENLDWIEKHKIPFIFTLYPGGGLKVDSQESDNKLKKVLGSPMLRKVIVTQEYTFQYLKRKGFCDMSKVILIFGCVVPQASIVSKFKKKSTYPSSKKTLDICFCAAKYMKEGKDKGYDVFIRSAKELVKKFAFVRFHIIGGFGEDDISLNEISHLVTFYGYVDHYDLKDIFMGIDILVSPNRPFTLSKGAFDGFPLGTAIEAALNGVLVIAADELNENNMFKNQSEIIIIESKWESIFNEIESLITRPDRIQEISRKGREKFKMLYSNNYQMEKRIELIAKEIKAL